MLRDAGFDMDLDGIDSHSLQYQNANNSVRVTDEFMQAVVDDRDWELTARTDRRGRADRAGAGAVPGDRGGRMGVRRSRACSSTPPSTSWHTAPNTGRINGSNPCSEYRAPRQLRLQSRQPQPADLPGRGRDVRRRRVQGRRRGGVHRSGDPRRQCRLPDGVDRRELATLPPARSRLRQSRRAADGPGPALRLGRGPGVGGCPHRAADGPRLRHLGPHGGPHGSLRRVPRERRADDQRAAHAPGGGGQDRRGARALPSCSRPPRSPGTRRSSSASSTACATPRPVSSRRPGPSAC